ncbi:hypothetical protein [Sporolactobacillus sp. THM19-2]|uniref:hypothetical protein n=1 Tax=Sporolactobacillus sp. THM19-2 TaxID=2511171 RepID=UPI00101F66BA|nr:hypothetical protein [Sporolactobacillus sp. THM19-2]RYL91667.1 hypothetical protein EWH91_08800 [Sporolactobacillus sp. THM19-2]
MPTISKIRLTNVIYEEGNKRYNDELFLFDGHNGAILIENGGGKTVFIQTVLQAILPHTDLADRKIKNTLMLNDAPAHIAIEWVIHERPRRYVVTAVSLFMVKNSLDSLRYVYEYNENDPNGIEHIPFVREIKGGQRPAERVEIQDYYSGMNERTPSAQTFKTIKEYRAFLEDQYNIISSEWESVVKINSSEGGVEAFFDECKTTNQLFDRLLIPTVEDSIVGHDRHLFSGLFEEQLASLRNYKRLNETLEENKEISAELETYSNTCEKLHGMQADYDRTRSRAKGIWNELVREQHHWERNQEKTNKDFQNWQADSHTHQVKVDSCTIFTERLALDDCVSHLNQVRSALAGTQDALRKTSQEYYTLKWARAKKEKQEQEEALSLYQHQLDQYDRKEDVHVLNEQLIHAKRELLGCYEKEFETLEAQLKDIDARLHPVQKRILELHDKKKSISEKEKGVSRRLSELRGSIKVQKTQLDKLKRELLADPAQETVGGQLALWQERVQYLDEAIISLVKKQKDDKAQSEEAQKEKERRQEEQNANTREIDRLKDALSNMEKAKKDVIIQLADLRPQWAALEDVYLNPESIEKRLTESINRLEQDHEDLLFKERAALRFVDDYGHQDLFFCDPFLEKQLTSWKNQFDYLVTGVEYLQTMSAEEREKHLDYSLWPLTLVTTQTGKEKIIDKLGHISDRLQYPVKVLTTEEALTVQDQAAIQSWVAPDHWKGNIDAAAFEEWKAHISVDAEKMTSRRKDKEREREKWKGGLLAFRKFLNDYPYETIETQKAQLNEVMNKREAVIVALQQLEHILDALQNEMKKSKEKETQYRDEKHGRERYIEKGYDYLLTEKEMAGNRKMEQDAEEKLQTVSEEIAAVEGKLIRLGEKSKELTDRRNRVYVQLRMSRDNEDYQMLTSLTPAETDESKKVIHERITILEMKLKKIATDRNEWAIKHDEAQKVIRKLHEEMAELKKDYDEIDESCEFPQDGKQLIEDLRVRRTALAGKKERRGHDMQQAKTVKDRQESKTETLIIQFKSKYPDDPVIPFDITPGEVRAELEKEQDDLIKQKASLVQTSERIDKELQAINQAMHQLELFEEAHHFIASDPEPVSLTNEELMEFSYNRLKFVQTVTRDLKENRHKVDQGRSVVEEAQKQFRDFCRKRITDVKLRQMAISGVETKESYEEIMAFRHNMSERIDSISHYAREHIRQSDKDRQMFIDQIHTHLKTLTGELKQIPRKTKVKVQNDWKTIYSFTIPDWSEEEGKARIRNYIDWILQQLENERFLDDEGHPDMGKIRKELDMWLQSKQLLRAVMDNQAMKVTCRKVTNDSMVTTRSYSWEQSNIWSGGEKWSKNMTLFLGILNYVAEKKKYLQSGAKLNRAVILDNPFGQASSDHVLNPVFFVAQQLGFQIIALTALAEGKFLQDYFPVIYSCRLRGSGSGKQVMTKEKWIRKAFFEDQAPQSLERLGETEQLGLFD